MLLAADGLVSAFSEWQSEVIEAKAQETSQAAPIVEAASSSARIEHAKIRRNIIQITIVRQSHPAVQLKKFGVLS
jgi:hypothetical protein